jgi:SAM-dependent methyltransferase
MKVRDSGMPEEAQWATFFRPDEILDRLGLLPGAKNIVEFGCGYGTFTVPAARRSRGTVYSFDIEPEMVLATQDKAHQQGAANVRVEQRDFLAAGTGLVDGSAEYAMLFNILHLEEPLKLLAEAHRVLAAGGLMGLMHWNYDAATPRGPGLEIRPRPQDCHDWAREAGFEILRPGIVDLPPYHYGLLGKKKSSCERRIRLSS